MEMYVEPYIAWRSWEIMVDERRQALRLRSITHRVKWPPGAAFRAHCLEAYRTIRAQANPNNPHSAPNKAHGCGIYAVKTEEQAIRWRDFGAENILRCHGTVKLWGVVYRYTHGFLAEYAYPEKIWVPPVPKPSLDLQPEEAVHELRRTYRGVEVRLS